MKTQINIWFKCCFVITLGLFISACGAGKQTEKVNVAGIYSLISIGDNAVPATVSEGGHTLKVLSGSFTINDNGTCISKMIFVPQGGTEQTMEVNATYSISDSTLTMQWQNAGVTTGTISGNTFSMINEGVMLVFKK